MAVLYAIGMSEVNADRVPLRQRQALEAKYESLAVPVLGVAGAKRLHDAIESIDTLKDMGELARASAKS